MNLLGITIEKVDGNYPALSGDQMIRYVVPDATRMYRGMTPDDIWLNVDATYAEQIQQRVHYAQNMHDVVIARLEGDEIKAAEMELRDRVVDYMLNTYPDHFTRQENIVQSKITGVTVDLDVADPMDACAVLAAEDFTIMMPSEKNDKDVTLYRLKSGVLIFPSGWSLTPQYKGDDEDLQKESKDAARLGKSMREIHDPYVPHYVNHFMDKVETGMAHMKPGMGLWRRNWSPLLTDNLMRHADFIPEEYPEFSNENWENLGILRVEQQTLTKMPQSGAIVFGIKTYQWKMNAVMNEPVARDALLLGLDNLSPEMQEYRGNSLPSFKEYAKPYRPS